MIWSLLVVVTLGCLTESFAQDDVWKLEQKDLEKMIIDADLIFEGRPFAKKNPADKPILKVTEMMQGAQRLNKVTLAEEISLENLKVDSDYIFFLKKASSNYSFIETNKGIINSDLFLKVRIRKAIMQKRVESSQGVVLAEIKKVTEENIKDSKDIQVIAECERVASYKGNIPEKFSLKYRRTQDTFPSPAIIFSDLSYFFFLKKSPDGDFYTLVDVYDGAFLDRYYLRKEISSVTQDSALGYFVEMAGNTVNGLRVVGQAVETTVVTNKPVKFHFLLQNVSEKDIEIYHNQVLYFTLFHVIDEENKIIPVKYPKKNTVPPLDKRHFLELSPGGYFVLPSIDLRNYCELPEKGKLNVYIEFHLPWEYSGKTIGKEAWSGKVVSNKIEIEIEIETEKE